VGVLGVAKALALRSEIMSNFKRMVQARIDKTGESWSTAARYVRAQVGEAKVPHEGMVTPRPGNLASLLVELGAPSTFAVLTGRVPARGASASFAAAETQMRRLLTDPLWYAETGAVQKVVTYEQHQELVREGAADDTRLQMIRSFRNEHKFTFSDRCRKCERWIWCDEEERAGKCFCGAEYRIVFDLAPVYHWTTLAHNARCMDCGVERIPQFVGTGISPWHTINRGQVQCNICFARSGARPVGAPMEIRVFRYKCDESLNGKPCTSGHGVHRAPNQPAPPLRDDLFCTLHGRIAHMTLAEPREGTIVTMSRA
jgi:hypothetical protein